MRRKKKHEKITFSLANVQKVTEENRERKLEERLNDIKGRIMYAASMGLNSVNITSCQGEQEREFFRNEGFQIEIRKMEPGYWIKW